MKKKEDNKGIEIKNESRPLEDYALDPTKFVSASTSEELKEELGVTEIKEEPKAQPEAPVKKKVTISPRFQTVTVTDEKTGKLKTEMTTVSHNALDRKTGQVIEAQQYVTDGSNDGATPMIAIKKKKVRSRWFSLTLAFVFIALSIAFAVVTYFTMPTFMQMFTEFNKPGWWMFFILPVMIILLLLAVSAIPMITFGILAAVFFGNSMRSPVKGVRITSIIMFVISLILVVGMPILILIATIL